MKTLIVLLTFILVTLVGCSGQRTDERSKLQVVLDSLITREHQKNDFDGTIVIGTNTAVLYEKAMGTANRVWDISMRLDHRFDICSINKSFIGTLTLIAVEEGKLSLDDTLINLLARFNYSGTFDPEVTIHHMLTHTSGLPDYGQVMPALYKDNGRLFKRKHFTNEQYVDFISRLPTKGKAGGQFYYSNFAYHLLSIVLEEVYQQPFSELVNKRICQPLGLKSTFSTNSNTEVFERLVEPYNYDEGTDSWNRNQFIDLTLGRRIFSTAYDLYLWGAEMSAPSLLNQKSAALMRTNHVGDINTNISYGYGWVVFDGQRKYRTGDLGIDRKYIIHGGSTEGYKSMLINIENGQYIIAFLANTGSRTNEMVLAKTIVDILINSENEK